MGPMLSASNQEKCESISLNDFSKGDETITIVTKDIHGDGLYSTSTCVKQTNSDDFRGSNYCSISKRNNTIQYCVDTRRLNYIKEAITKAKILHLNVRKTKVELRVERSLMTTKKEPVVKVTERKDNCVQKEVAESEIKLDDSVASNDINKPFYGILKNYSNKSKSCQNRNANTNRLIRRLKKRSIRNLLNKVQPSKLRQCRVRGNNAQRNLEKKQNNNSESRVAVAKIKDWFTNYIPLKNPYYPQIGDEIIVCVAAYKQFLEEIHNNFPNTVTEKVCPSPVKKLFQFQGIVRHIEFVHREYNSSHYFIHIAVEIVKRKKLVNLWWCNRPIPDFIVLKCDYKYGDFLVGDRFRILVNQMWWRGTITTFTPKLPKLETSFGCFEVRYDNGETGELSPWHLHELGNDKSTKKSGTPLYTYELPMLLYEPKEDEWPSCGREYECSRIFDGLTTLLETNVGNMFHELHTRRYLGMTIHGIDLHTILYRLYHLYYRRKQAIEFDCEHLHQSLMSFIERDRKDLAESYFKKIMLFINDENCCSIRYIFLKVHPQVDIY